MQAKKRLIKKYFYGGLADFAVDEGKEIAAASACLILQKQSMRSWKKERLNTINNRQQFRTAKKMSRPELL